jgi:putative zinc finger/helix-turn-helix YgiT family protein
MPSEPKRRPKGPVGRRRPHEDACFECGTIMRPHRGRLDLPVNGEKMAVTGIAHLRCPKCGEGILSLEAARELSLRAHAAYRERFGLLSPNEIRSIRVKYGLTQSQLAKLLRLGDNTLSRWEAGRIVQSAAMDLLLRLLRDLPENLRYLRKHAA